ncbi:MAG: hypothetical protein KAX49_07160 [Halanaerobiales bacterium]|nr:hypothetical protein [Halanaerobiales bacterium]
MKLHEALEYKKAYSPETAVKAKVLAEMLYTTTRTISELGLEEINQDVVSDKQHGFFIAKRIEHQVHNYQMLRSTVKNLEIRMYRLNNRMNERMNESE